MQNEVVCNKLELILICLVGGEGVGLLELFFVAVVDDPFLYQQDSCWDKVFPGSWGTVGLCEWPPSDRDMSLTSVLLLLACCLLFFLFLTVLLSPPSPRLFFSYVAVWLWVVVLHGIALSLPFRSSCFLLVRPRGFQRLQSFQVFLSERQKLMWRSCPDLWERAAQQ